MAVDKELLETFIDCCRYGELKEIQEITANLSPKEIQELATTPRVNSKIAIFMLCANGHSEILELILPHLNKSDLNICNDQGNTCLHWAAINNQEKVVEILLAHGCQESRNSFGFSAATLAEQRGFLKVANMILMSYDPESDNEKESVEVEE